MATKRKTKQKTTRLPYDIEHSKAFNVLVKAANDAYADHERSTSDPYLKKRIRNAVWQVVTRCAVELWPDVAAYTNTQTEPWNVSADDVSRLMAEVGRA